MSTYNIHASFDCTLHIVRCTLSTLDLSRGPQELTKAAKPLLNIPPKIFSLIQDAHGSFTTLIAHSQGQENLQKYTNFIKSFKMVSHTTCMWWETFNDIAVLFCVFSTIRSFHEEKILDHLAWCGEIVMWRFL